MLLLRAVRIPLRPATASRTQQVRRRVSARRARALRASSRARGGATRAHAGAARLLSLVPRGRARRQWRQRRQRGAFAIFIVGTRSVCLYNILVLSRPARRQRVCENLRNVFYDQEKGSCEQVRYRHEIVEQLHQRPAHVLHVTEVGRERAVARVRSSSCQSCTSRCRSRSLASPRVPGARIKRVSGVRVSRGVHAVSAVRVSIVVLVSLVLRPPRVPLRQ